MDDRKAVKAFDVYNFDKPGAKDIIGTAQHVVDEQKSQERRIPNVADYDACFIADIESRYGETSV